MEKGVHPAQQNIGISVEIAICRKPRCRIATEGGTFCKIVLHRVKSAWGQFGQLSQIEVCIKVGPEKRLIRG
jgi:hypothetical protein